MIFKVISRKLTHDSIIMSKGKAIIKKPSNDSISVFEDRAITGNVPLISLSWQVIRLLEGSLPMIWLVYAYNMLRHFVHGHISRHLYKSITPTPPLGVAISHNTADFMEMNQLMYCPLLTLWTPCPICIYSFVHYSNQVWAEHRSTRLSISHLIKALL